MDTCLCMAESLYCAAEMIRTLLIGYTPIQNTIDAVEAFRVGLVNRGVPVAQLMAAAGEIATKICLGAPLSVIAIKEAITRGIELPIEQGLKLESELSLTLSTTEDQREGSRAFAEKRTPAWKGR